MFLKMPLHFFLWCLFLIARGQAVQACATGEHHSTTFHYNNAHQVFVGVLLQQEKNNQSDTTLLTFRIKKAYKNCQAGQVIQIQGSTYTTALLRTKSSHLVYASMTLSKTLYCPKLEALKTANTSRQIKVIEAIVNHPSGEEFIEYSPYGGIWAKGYYDNGNPYHNWIYYAYSGEPKIKGQYVRGLRSSQWNTYGHTKDEEYKILQKIISGAYAKEWDDYTVLSVDTSMEQKFRYKLSYLVEGDTVVEQFYYNKPYLIQYRFYREGQQHGLENSFKEDGLAYKTYTFQNGRLHGVFRELLPWAQEEGAYIEVKGTFVADKREEEVHHYYNGQGHFLYKKVIVEKGKIL